MGLKEFRENKDGRNNSKEQPEHKCSNCGCIRYNPCTCQKKSK